MGSTAEAQLSSWPVNFKRFRVTSGLFHKMHKDRLMQRQEERKWAGDQSKGSGHTHINSMRNWLNRTKQTGIKTQKKVWALTLWIINECALSFKRKLHGWFPVAVVTVNPAVIYLLDEILTISGGGGSNHSRPNCPQAFRKGDIRKVSRIINDQTGHLKRRTAGKKHSGNSMT